MDVVRFLRDLPFEAVLQKLRNTGIKVTLSQLRPHLYALSYRDNSIFYTKKYGGMNSMGAALQSRGLILRKDTNQPVCVPFYKFFNFGEEQAHPIDWSTALVYEKVDGSLIKVICPRVAFARLLRCWTYESPSLTVERFYLL